MFLTIHATAGVLIGEQINNIWLAYILGFISHFLLDLIPHGDKPARERTFQERRILAFKSGSIDAGVMIITLLLLWQNNLIGHPLAALAGAAGGITPDFFVGLYFLTLNSVLKKFYSLHKSIQDFIEKIEYPVWPGLVVQYIILILLIILLAKL